MNTRTTLLIFTVAVLALGSCAEGPRLPVKTSLGDLVRIEKKTSIQTSDGNIDAKTDELLYLLSFEGKKELAFEGKAEAEGPKTFRLIDSKGTSYGPAFAGTPTAEGVISDKEWKYNGGLTGRDGKWVFTGALEFPDPKISLVYKVPKDASGLKLKDGNETHAIS